VISRPSTGISFSAAFSSKDLSIPTINFAVAPFVITTSFSSFDFFGTKPKLHLTLDSNAHSINLILTGKYSGSIKTTWYPSRAGIPRKVTFP
jgi:hypothetical protein